MKLFVVIGMPASGKNIGRSYAELNGIPYFATGDIVRAEVSRRGLEPNPENTARVSDEIRGSDGMGVTRKVLETAIKTGREVVFLEGMRSWPEIELLRREADCTIIAFLAPRQTRLSRILSRGRTDDVPDAFDARDARELSYGAAIPIALADAYVLNTGSMEDALEALDRIVRAG
ncbi:MAG: AAA family ATPase [Syntrophobacteraceae bacterium]